MDEIVIDGSQGEGGGQVLRTALSLSMVTGTAFRMTNIRARRKRPGLRRQHLTAVQAAQTVSSADVEGASPGASEITFSPNVLCPGNYAFDIGTAGSTTLVAQTLIPALIMACAPSHITLDGGTHNPMSPPFEFFRRAYLPLLNCMGADAHAVLIRPGFYPAGGGRIEVTITPVGPLSTIDLSARGALRHKEARAIVSHLPLSIAQRELDVIRDALVWPEHLLHVHDEKHSKGPGNILVVTLTFEQLTEVFTGFGQRGVPAEKVANTVVKCVSAYLASDAAVETHLADQLLIPIALAGGGRFTTCPPSQHTTTNIGIIEMFLPVRIGAEQIKRDLWSISIQRASEDESG
jgi:RNA 3'-terminal phosphate cyclase (ATP)